MNTSPAQINSAAPAPVQANAGKSQDPASDTPFSQVLSSEIAQSQRSDAATKSDKTDKVDKSDKADTGAEAAADGVDPTAAAASPAVKTDPVPIAAAFDMLRTDAGTVSPEMFLSLAAPSDRGVPESAGLETDANDGQGLATPSPTERKGRELQKGLSAKALQAAGRDNAAAGTQKPELGQTTKADASFLGQLAAARQSESVKNGDPIADLLSNPIMRAAAQAPTDAPTPLSGASANRLAPSVGTAAWGQALGEKVVWMAAGSQQTASLTLNPPNLGPLQIVLNISNDQATASFFSAQPEVRQALEAAFPRLREMMGEAGIALGQATVSADTPQQQAFDQPAPRGVPSFLGGETPDSTGLASIQPSVLRTGRGLVDTFA
jgi:flagellar hook-length control protein FliK